MYRLTRQNDKSCDWHSNVLGRSAISTVRLVTSLLSISRGASFNARYLVDGDHHDTFPYFFYNFFQLYVPCTYLHIDIE